MTRMEITYKSGATLTVDATDVKWTRHGDELVSIEWVTPPNAKRKLLMLPNLNEIVAIVRIA